MQELSFVYPANVAAFLKMTLICLPHFLQDYHRPSVEEILESPLIADLVAEEQRRKERGGEGEAGWAVFLPCMAPGWWHMSPG